MSAQSITYSGAPLDRAATLRPDAAKVQALLSGGAARIVPVWTGRHLVDDTPRAVTLSFAAVEPWLHLAATPPIFLGLKDDTAWFALGLKDSERPPELGVGGQFRVLNEVVALLPGDEAAILAYARAMVIWHGNHVYCGRCGAPTEPTEGGHSRTCSNAACGQRSFPRTDPAVITLVEDPDGARALLGRQAKWVNGMYSVIAGFVEPGESLEETVARETFEETGVRVADVRYVASQPWPFPASIMLGFRARARTTAIVLGDDELQDCAWFTRAELHSFGRPDGPYPDRRLPNPFSIARFLLNTWLAEG
ncbi:MAG: NAD(+) diphosphatase [Rhodospirillaceae bacterium]|nr:NAD(+) diphosphatase [Rhodospirillaceae bacterium]